MFQFVYFECFYFHRNKKRDSPSQHMLIITLIHSLINNYKCTACPWTWRSEFQWSVPSLWPWLNLLPRQFSILFREKIVLFSTSSRSWANWGSSTLKKSVHPMEKKLPWLISTHPSPRRPLSLGRGRILISGLILSPPTLAFYDFHLSLPLGRDFSYSKDEV